MKNYQKPWLIKEKYSPLDLAIILVGLQLMDTNLILGLCFLAAGALMSALIENYYDS